MRNVVAVLLTVLVLIQTVSLISAKKNKNTNTGNLPRIIIRAVRPFLEQEESGKLNPNGTIRAANGTFYFDKDNQKYKVTYVVQEDAYEVKKYSKIKPTEVATPTNVSGKPDTLAETLHSKPSAGSKNKDDESEEDNTSDEDDDDSEKDNNDLNNQSNFGPSTPSAFNNYGNQNSGPLGSSYPGLGNPGSEGNSSGLNNLGIQNSGPLGYSYPGLGYPGSSGSSPKLNNFGDQHSRPFGSSYPGQWHLISSGSSSGNNNYGNQNSAPLGSSYPGLGYPGSSGSSSGFNNFETQNSGPLGSSYPGVGYPGTSGSPSGPNNYGNQNSAPLGSSYPGLGYPGSSGSSSGFNNFGNQNTGPLGTSYTRLGYSGPSGSSSGPGNFETPNDDLYYRFGYAGQRGSNTGNGPLGTSSITVPGFHVIPAYIGLGGAPALLIVPENSGAPRDSYPGSQGSVPDRYGPINPKPYFTDKYGPTKPSPCFPYTQGGSGDASRFQYPSYGQDRIPQDGCDQSTPRPSSFSQSSYSSPAGYSGGTAGSYAPPSLSDKPPNRVTLTRIFSSGHKELAIPHDPNIVAALLSG